MKNSNGWEGKIFHARHAAQPGAWHLILGLMSKLGYFCYQGPLSARKIFSLPAIEVFHHREDVCQVPLTVRARGGDRAGFEISVFYILHECNLNETKGALLL